MKVQLREDYQVPAVEQVRQALTAEWVRECLHYDTDTGVFTWKQRPVHHFPDERAAKSWNTCFAGTVAGAKNVVSGYVQIGFRAQKHYAHRLAFLWMMGEWPADQVDHINGTRDDNRWSNLRQVSCAVNLQNIRQSKRKSGGLLGYHLDTRDGRFQAQIRANGKTHSLGRFDTEEEAHAAYLKAKRELHEGCTL